MRRLTYDGRDSEKNEASDMLGYETGDLKFKDRYRIRVSPGIYRIIIKGFENYRFANFRVSDGETTKFQINEDSFAWDTICRGSILILKTIDNLEPRSRQERRYRSRPYRPVSTDRILLEAPFEFVVRHCGKKNKGSRTFYKSAEVNYRNVFIDAEDLVVDRRSFILEAMGSEQIPVKVRFADEEIKEFRRVKIDLRRLTILEDHPLGSSFS
ncbi:MAG: hypothetical protein IPJ30_00620 [Acidobacteria bacterium]|nr:hypothetical protein [Acidobacteriota bacterium]